MLHAPRWGLVCLLVLPACQTRAVRRPEEGSGRRDRGVTQAAVDSGAVATARRVTALADANFAGRLAACPEDATTHGIPGSRHDRLNVGAMELRRLREQAERALAARFDVRAFHDQVLDDGAVPLPMLRGKITPLDAQRQHDVAVLKQPPTRH